MIDIHFHCLPRLDDGPGNWDEAVALCREAARQGAKQLIATPHVHRGTWANDDETERDRLVLRLNTLLEGRPAILPGCEYFFSTEAIALLDQEPGPLTGLNRSRYLLLELPPDMAPGSAEPAFHEFGIADITPVIAHPERHPGFRRNPDALARLVSRGALAQVTAGSLLGDFGERALEAAEEFLRRGLVHFVASDAHNLERRPPRLAAARKEVRRRWGANVEAGLFEVNPAALVASEPIPWSAASSAPASSSSSTRGEPLMEGRR